MDEEIFALGRGLKNKPYLQSSAMAASTDFSKSTSSFHLAYEILISSLLAIINMNFEVVVLLTLL